MADVVRLVVGWLKGETPEERLVAYAAEGDVVAVKAMLDRGVPANARRRADTENGEANATVAASRGESALHAAVRGRHAEVALELIARGADVNTRSGRDDEPILGVAVAARMFHVAASLLTLGANPNASTRTGHSPLTLAVLAGDIALVHVLLCRGADPEQAVVGFYAAAGQAGATPMLLAAQEGRDDIVEMLLSFGANRDPRACRAASAQISYLTAQGYDARRSSHSRVLMLLGGTTMPRYA